MMWLFIILGVSGVVAVLAIVAIFARVRRRMKAPAMHEDTHDPEN